MVRKDLPEQPLGKMENRITEIVQGVKERMQKSRHKDENVTE